MLQVIRSQNVMNLAHIAINLILGNIGNNLPITASGLNNIAEINIPVKNNNDRAQSISDPIQ
jgi:hypothetical protein